MQACPSAYQMRHHQAVRDAAHLSPVYAKLFRISRAADLTASRSYHCLILDRLDPEMAIKIGLFSTSSSKVLELTMVWC